MSDSNDGPSNKHEIKSFMHCGLCFAEVQALVKARKPARSMAEYADIECGWTPRGFQVWCRRHNANICHVDFEGRKHKANTTMEPRATSVPAKKESKPS